MAPTTRSVMARMTATHLPLEIWRIIISSIHFDDRPKAWFTLRLLCHMSKIAVEDIYARYYLPHMRLFATAKQKAGAYCFTGLVADGETATFCKWASNAHVAWEGDTIFETWDPTHWFNSIGRCGEVSEQTGVFVTHLRSNPYCLSPYPLEGHTLVRNGIPWKRLLSMVLRSPWDPERYTRLSKFLFGIIANDTKAGSTGLPPLTPSLRTNGTRPPEVIYIPATDIMGIGIQSGNAIHVLLRHLSVKYNIHHNGVLGHITYEEGFPVPRDLRAKVARSFARQAANSDIQTERLGLRIHLYEYATPEPSQSSTAGSTSSMTTTITTKPVTRNYFEIFDELEGALTSHLHLPGITSNHQILHHCQRKRQPAHNPTGHFDIVSGQLVHTCRDGVAPLYITVEDPADKTERKLQTRFDMTRNGYGTFAFRATV
ncbi:hypothetical protein CONLIGDRAFT_687181 [Coniochaeta ligniaria NRRL 30616]|uniref:Uncharacterized protein n=1 Tax=Coniochaeta ligniaria NRRL 30616 TaxID=1408157 RepID=A0A1J7I5X1_9PEZI|nr:hypothetical protein CONLIGDRAFT_687181 [Coniochaeta ligniaria NRRL 30616]